MQENNKLQTSTIDQHPLRCDLSQKQRTNTNYSYVGSSVKLKWGKVPQTFPCVFMWL